MSGITVSRSTLTQQVQRAIALLKPIYDAQLEHLLQSKVLAMDETPTKAGRGKPGKMKQAWFWPVYGQDDEVCFIYSPSRGSQVVIDALGEHFDGTLVTDGHSAYTCFARNAPRSPMPTAGRMRGASSKLRSKTIPRQRIKRSF
jgi:transposase